MHLQPRAAGQYLVAGLLILIMIATWVSPFDRPAASSIDAGLKRAFVTFAAARGLNALISAAQGTEITIGAGASATFSIGEVLDPINDLVEKFADFMLLATVSFGIQKVLLSIGQHVVLQIALSILLIGWGALHLLGRRPPPILNTLLIIGLMARFAIPLATVATEAVFDTFLREDYLAGEQQIAIATQSVKDLSPDPSATIQKGEEMTPARDAAAAKVEDVTPVQNQAAPEDDEATSEQDLAAPKEEKGFFARASESMTRMLDSAKRVASERTSDETPPVNTQPTSSPHSASPEKKGSWDRLKGWVAENFDPARKLKELQKAFERLKDSVEQTARHVVSLIVVFLLETLIVPLAILWALYRSVKSVFGSAGRETPCRCQETIPGTAATNAAPTVGN